MAARKRKSAKPKKKRSAKTPTRPTVARTINQRTKGKRRRYSEAERSRILETAKREHLTGAQVRARFGVSTLTFYTWRKKAGATRVTRRRRHAGPPRGPAGTNRSLAVTLRREVRSRIARMLPEIIRTEIAGAIGSARSRRRRRG